MHLGVEIMKKTALIFCLGFFAFSCSQKENNLGRNEREFTYDINQFISPEAKEITAENFVNKLNSQIKHFDSYFLLT